MGEENGSHVTRAELGWALKSIDARLSRIEERLDARPVQRWLAGRVTRLIDRGLPAFLVGAVVLILK